MFVLSGSFGPRETFPAVLRAVGDWLPLTHSYDLLTYLWLGGTWGVEDDYRHTYLGLLRLSGRASGALRRPPAYDCSGGTKLRQSGHRSVSRSMDHSAKRNLNTKVLELLVRWCYSDSGVVPRGLAL